MTIPTSCHLSLWREAFPTSTAFDMLTQHIRPILAAALFGLLTCGTALATPEDAANAAAPQASSAAQAAPIATLVVPPTTVKVSIENRGGPLDMLALPGFLATKNIQAGRVADFNQLLSQRQFDAPRELHAALLGALQAEGLAVVPTPGLLYLADDPESIDYIKTAPASPKVMVVTVRELGLYSGRLSRQFVPKLNISVELINKDKATTLYDEWLYYGADASKDTALTALSDPQHAYASYGEAVERGDDLIASYRAGIVKLAKLAAAQVKPLLRQP